MLITEGRKNLQCFFSQQTWRSLQMLLRLSLGSFMLCMLIIYLYICKDAPCPWCLQIKLIQEVEMLKFREWWRPCVCGKKKIVSINNNQHHHWNIKKRYLNPMCPNIMEQYLCHQWVSFWSLTSHYAPSLQQINGENKSFCPRTILVLIFWRSTDLRVSLYWFNLHQFSFYPLLLDFTNGLLQPLSKSLIKFLEALLW